MILVRWRAIYYSAKKADELIFKAYHRKKIADDLTFERSEWSSAGKRAENSPKKYWFLVDFGCL